METNGPVSSPRAAPCRRSSAIPSRRLDMRFGCGSRHDLMRVLGASARHLPWNRRQGVLGEDVWKDLESHRSPELRCQRGGKDLDARRVTSRWPSSWSHYGVG